MRALESSRQRDAYSRNSRDIPNSQAATGFPPVPPEDSPKAGLVEDRKPAGQGKGRMDVRQAITDRIIAMLEKGGNVFRERWTHGASRGMPRNGKTGAPYHGANVLLLWDAAIEHGYASNVWLTYKQAASMGAQVRRGERAVLCAHFERKASGHQNDSDRDAGGIGESHGEGEGGAGDSANGGNSGNSGNAGRSSMLLCMPFWLFNVAQIDGLPAPAPHELQERKAWADRSPIEGAMRFIGGCQARIEHRYLRAAYSPGADRILMPDIECFTSPEAYCATALHELVHWTGHETRLNRSFGQRFGDAAYAFEELVAELGCAFVLGHIGLVDATIEGHAAYLDSWLQVLRNDRTAIFTAARHAGEAYEFILARELP
ncbi:zincin-like metallopeptidase domain-containing protein [Variovorax sp. dw_954]|uniref:ArdC family protein n=1 Tax=Variovorax sp. dw_954 TaxID=2720078 RepID=UPI00211729E7|nr:zincin-like metallopeptidase domain-containing protein [Variovorax sp. dw_954]